MFKFMDSTEPGMKRSLILNAENDKDFQAILEWKTPFFTDKKVRFTKEDPPMEAEVVLGNNHNPEYVMFKIYDKNESDDDLGEGLFG